MRASGACCCAPCRCAIAARLVEHQRRAKTNRTAPSRRLSWGANQGDGEALTAAAANGLDDVRSLRCRRPTAITSFIPERALARPTPNTFPSAGREGAGGRETGTPQALCDPAKLFGEDAALSSPPARWNPGRGARQDTYALTVPASENAFPKMTRWLARQPNAAHARSPAIWIGDGMVRVHTALQIHCICTGMPMGLEP